MKFHSAGSIILIVPPSWRMEEKNGPFFFFRGQHLYERVSAWRQQHRERRKRGIRSRIVDSTGTYFLKEAPAGFFKINGSDDRVCGADARNTIFNRKFSNRPFQEKLPREVLIKGARS